MTTERFARLYRLLHHIDIEPRTREELLEKLGVDVRGFYRDLEFLRSVGIVVRFQTGKYSLSEPGERLFVRLPYPDPHLTLGEVQQLARGKTKLQQALQSQIDKLLE